MSHLYRKTTYVVEGSYGVEETKNLYMHLNNSCDICTIYDDDWGILLCFGDTTSRPLDKALYELIWDDPEKNNKVKYFSDEDRENFKNKR